MAEMLTRNADITSRISRHGNINIVCPCFKRGKIFLRNNDNSLPAKIKCIDTELALLKLLCLNFSKKVAMILNIL